MKIVTSCQHIKVDLNKWHRKEDAGTFAVIHEMCDVCATEFILSQGPAEVAIYDPDHHFDDIAPEIPRV